MSITSIGATPSVRPIGVPAGPALPTTPVPPVQAPVPLAPAVKVDIRGQDSGPDSGPDSRPAPVPVPVPDVEARTPAAEPAAEPRIRIDRETRAVVYQELDPNSGDVIVQLPDPVVLKARAYAEAAEARARPLDRPLDRTA